MNIRLVLTYIFIVSIFATAVFALSGSGTIADPYQIYNCTDLNDVRNNVTAAYKLMNDVDCNVSPYNNETGFYPIGSEASPFTGNFDGNGKVIENLKMNFSILDSAISEHIGLFGSIDGANVSRLGLENVWINNDLTTGAPNRYTGALVGNVKPVSFPRFIEVYSTGYVQSKNNILGGLVGRMTTGQVNDSYSKATTNRTANFHSAGLIGSTGGSVAVNRCYATELVIAANTANGLLGDSAAGSVTSSYYDNQTTNTSVSAGGGTGKTTVEMLNQSTYAGWNFTNTWYMNDGVDYPVLRAFGNYTLCGSSIDESTTLTQSYTCNGTFATINASNIELNCAGYSILFDGNGTGADGIIASNVNNVTVKNCILNDGNAGGSQGYGMSFLNVNNSVVQNNTLQTNGTSLNHGIVFDSNSYNNKIDQNTIFTNGSSNGNFGIYLTTTVNNNNITSNYVRTGGTSDNHGIRLQSGASNNLIENNTVLGRGTTTENFGIYLFTGAINNTIQDNNISSEGTGNNRGIILEGSYDSLVRNNSISTIGTSGSNFGIYVTTGYDNNITNNIIWANGTSAIYGINIVSSPNGTIYNNEISANGLSGNINGISLINSPKTNISENEINSSGTSGNYGVWFGSTSGNSTVNNNGIYVYGGSIVNIGVYFSNDLTNASVSQNTITAEGNSQNSAIFAEDDTSGLVFNSNTLFALGTSSYGITANSSSAIFNNTILNNTVDWINASSSSLNLTNTSFITTNGIIRIPSNINLNSTLDLNRQKLNISNNNAFVNSSSAQLFNVSAQITLDNVNSNVLLVDSEDDGTYSLCNSPRCQLQSFNGSTVVFNVSSFTSYSTSDFGGVNVTLSKSDLPDPINLSNTTILTYQINFTVNNGTAFNVTINETYSSNTTFVNATPAPTVGNISWNVGNLTTGQTYQVNITVNVSNSLANGTVLTNIVNATLENSTGGEFIINVTENTTVLNAVGLTCGNTVINTTTLTQNYSCSGTAFTLGAGNIEFNCNGYALSGDGTGSGVHLVDVTNVTIRNCLISSFNYGIYLYNATNSRFYNNSILNNTDGIRSLGSISESNQIYNNTVNSTTGYGVDVQSNYTNIQNNTIYSQTGNALNSNGDHAIITGNVIISNGVIAASLSKSNTTFTGNTVLSTASNALYIFGNNSLIQNNNITSTADNAITSYSHNIIYNSNIINSTTSNGFYLSSGGNLTITNNIVNSSGGIDLNAGIGNSTVTGNNCTSTAGSGINIGSDNNTVMNNIVYSQSSNGLEVRGDYNNVTNNQAYAATNGQVGLFIESSNSYFYNNTAHSNNSYGLVLQDSNNNLLVNNTAIVDYNASLAFPPCAIGTAVGVGNNTFINTYAIAPNSKGIWLSNVMGNTQNNTFINTTIETNYTWIIADSTSTNNAFQNTTFKRAEGSITILSNATIPESTTVNVQKLNVGQNYSYLNSTNLTFLNTSAEIKINGLNYSDPQIFADYNDNGTLIACSSPDCNITSYTGGVLIFNVSHFTNYTVQENNATICGNITQSTILTQSVNSTGTCFTILADNIILNCNGHNITYATSATGFGINATNRTGLNITNCALTGAAFTTATAISLTNVSNSTIQNTNITNIPSNGIDLNQANNVLFNSIRQNNIGLNGFNARNSVNASLLNSQFENVTTLMVNNLTNCTVNNVYINSTGMSLRFDSGSNNIINNTNLTSGGSSGIVFGTSTQNNTIQNLIVQSAVLFGILQFSGTSGNSYYNITSRGNSAGMQFTGDRQTVNWCNLFSQTGRGLILSSATNTTISNCRISTGTNDAMAILATSQNITLQNITLESNLSWYEQATTSGNITFTNITFNNTYGRIKVFSAQAQPSEINQSKLNITQSSAFVNSTNLTYLNTSAEIILGGLNYSDPQIFADYNDNGTLVACNSPDCNITSYSGGILTFLVSHFTTYNVSEGGINLTLEKTDSQDPATPGGQLNYTININVTSGTAINVTLTEQFDSDTTYDSATPSPTSGNNWSIGNITAGQSYQINITVNISSTASGTITNTVNITYQNSTNDTLTASVQENTTITPTPTPSTSTGSGGGSGGSSSAICPPFCRYPENANLPVCRNNCVTQTAQTNYPTYPSFSNIPQTINEEPKEIEVQEDKIEKIEQAAEQTKEKVELKQPSAKFKIPENLFYYLFFALSAIGIITLLAIGHKHNKKNVEKSKIIKKQIKKNKR